MKLVQAFWLNTACTVNNAHSGFFSDQSEAEQTSDLGEKAFLYQLGHQWIEEMETSCHQEYGDTLYNKMWKSRIENAVIIIQVWCLM